MSGMSVSFDEPDGSVMWFELTIENTDTVDLPLAEARYSVMVDGETVFRGVRSAEATAPAMGNATVRLPASAPDGSVGLVYVDVVCQNIGKALANSLVGAAVVLGAGLKFALNEGLARWQLASGSTLLEGAVRHLGRCVGLA